MLQHMNTLLTFYGFETSKIKWLNYLSSQKAIQESVNILINGVKKYNKSRRKKTKENRKRRSKTRKPGTAQEERALTTIPKSKRNNKVCFEKGNSSKMPLVVFGEGLKNKDHIKFKGLRHAVSNKIYQQLKNKAKA
ncbi:uncharacterized protein BX663DRAFT_573207 [Cokeromyces recurvatus]|uniref:uncharacterized protein n=1 Tax=Cokeromyces recurvatus TaxID=90255 RepID=UPI0022205496|nr:uncharacterized protein BX663DRAFT_573207 [Cokeromyces recurvatus]KAI7907125.1 hypothetical protein BX663DRAFT_573207 [Cokeromyces recurvatus]